MLPLRAKTIFLILFLTSPLFWWNFISRLSDTYRIYLALPGASVYRVPSLFSTDFMIYQNDFRYNTLTLHGSTLESKIFYTKPGVIINEFTNYLGLFSPKHLFIESHQISFLFMIPFLLFFFSPYFSPKKHLLLLLFSPIFAFLVPNPPSILLLPVFLVIIYFSALYLKNSTKQNKLLLTTILMHNLLLFLLKL